MNDEDEMFHKRGKKKEIRVSGFQLVTCQTPVCERPNQIQTLLVSYAIFLGSSLTHSRIQHPQQCRNNTCAINNKGGTFAAQLRLILCLLIDLDTFKPHLQP